MTFRGNKKGLKERVAKAKEEKAAKAKMGSIQRSIAAAKAASERRQAERAAEGAEELTLCQKLHKNAAGVFMGVVLMNLAFTAFGAAIFSATENTTYDDYMAEAAEARIELSDELAGHTNLTATQLDTVIALVSEHADEYGGMPDRNPW